MRTWFITGCSSGLGRSLAEAVLKAGDQAVVTARKIESIQPLSDRYPDTALTLSLDVTDFQQIDACVKTALERFHSIDVLVNNAGYGYRAAVEEGMDDDVKKLFATNLFGPIHLMQQVLLSMRKARSGAIINVSSIAALGAAPGSGFYAATKSALESITEALRQETAPLGIKAMAIEPGAFRTQFAGTSLTESQKELSDYESTAGQRRIRNDHTDGKQQGSPDKAASVIISMVRKGHFPPRLLLGSDAVAYAHQQLTRKELNVREWASVSETTDYEA
jgi:NAD(P)-dependent dehydrogenase (short-subunit alcohol dehydrogenase family)